MNICYQEPTLDLSLSLLCSLCSLSLLRSLFSLCSLCSLCSFSLCSLSLLSLCSRSLLLSLSSRSLSLRSLFSLSRCSLCSSIAYFPNLLQCGRVRNIDRSSRLILMTITLTRRWRSCQVIDLFFHVHSRYGK